MGHEEHKEKATGPVACFVLTVSDTRSQSDDVGGNIIRGALDGAGHTITGGAIVPDDPEAVKETLDHLPFDTQAVIITGGTGVSHRDTTVDAVQPLFDKELPGFGELFRLLSFEEIGSAAMLSRATAGVIDHRVVFCIPGSTNAVNLAMNRLILPEIAHVVWELEK